MYSSLLGFAGFMSSHNVLQFPLSLYTQQPPKPSQTRLSHTLSTSTGPPPCALARNLCTRSGCARGGRCTLRATAELRHERGQGAREKSSGGRCVLFAQFLTYYMVRFVHCLSVPQYIYIIKRICFARVIDTIRNTCQNLLGGFQENDMSDGPQLVTYRMDKKDGPNAGML